MQKDEWFYRDGEQVYGPFSHSELRERAAAGEIEPDTLTRYASEEWRRADHVYFLSEFFPAVEISEESWQELQRSAIYTDAKKSMGHLIQLLGSTVLLIGGVALCAALEYAGVNTGKAGPLTLLIFGAAIFRSIFHLCLNGWEAAQEAIRLIWVELRIRGH